MKTAGVYELLGQPSYIWMENFRFTSTLLCKKYFRDKWTEPAIVYNTLLRVYICIHFPKNVSGKPPPLLANVNSRMHPNAALRWNWSTPLQ